MDYDLLYETEIVGTTFDNVSLCNKPLHAETNTVQTSIDSHSLTKVSDIQTESFLQTLDYYLNH